MLWWHDDAFPSYCFYLKIRFTYEVSPVFILMEEVLLKKMQSIVGWSEDEGDGIFCPGKCNRWTAEWMNSKYEVKHTIGHLLIGIFWDIDPVGQAAETHCPVVGAVLTAQHHRARLALDPDHQKWAVCHWHPVLLADESRFNHERICRCSGEHLQTTTSFSMIGLVLGHWWSGEAQTSTG